MSGYNSNRLIWNYTPGPTISGSSPLEPPSVQVWSQNQGLNSEFLGTISVLLAYNPNQICSITGGDSVTAYSGQAIFPYLVITASESGTFPLTMLSYCSLCDHPYSPESEVFYIYQE